MQRFFLRNLMPSTPQDLTGLGPVPAFLSSGGRISFRCERALKPAMLLRPCKQSMGMSLSRLSTAWATLFVC